MYLRFASSCVVEFKNFNVSFEKEIANNNWSYYQIPETLETPDVVVSFVDAINIESINKVAHPKYAVLGTKFCIKSDNGSHLCIDYETLGKKQSNLNIEKGFPLNELFDYLFDFVKIVLLNKDVICIHGSSFISRNNEAIIITGWEGVGKSAIMLNEVYKGAFFMSDDRVFLNKRGEVFPVYTKVKQYSGEFSVFKEELLKRVPIKKKIIILLNIMVQFLKKRKVKLFPFIFTKVLSILRRIKLYSINIDLSTLNVAKNEAYKLSKIYLVNHIKNQSEFVTTRKGGLLLTQKIVDTTSFDDMDLFKINLTHSYLFPDFTASILTKYSEIHNAVLGQVNSNIVDVSFDEQTKITDISEKLFSNHN